MASYTAALLLALVAVATAQLLNPQALVDSHNAEKRMWGVPGNYVWDDSLAAAAQQWAQRCVWEHDYSSNQGENLAASAGTPSVSDDGWRNERRYYDCNNNRCTGGECGHLTQMIWAGSNRIGCAAVQCPNGRGSPFSGSRFSTWNFLVCRYNPAGNVIGRHPTGGKCTFNPTADIRPNMMPPRGTYSPGGSADPVLPDNGGNNGANNGGNSGNTDNGNNNNGGNNGGNSGCAVSEWSQWSSCSRPCGGGVSKRTRTTIEAGGVCATYTRQASCNRQPCAPDRSTRPAPSRPSTRPARPTRPAKPPKQPRRGRRT